MPEGHTLHRLAHDLTDAFAGRPVRVGSPQGRFDAEARQLDGHTLEGAQAWGKQLFLEFPGERFIHIHLGLIGKLQLTPYDGDVPPPIGQVRLRLVSTGPGDDRRGVVADLRGATACDLWTRDQVDATVAKLGPDPLREDADPLKAWARIGRSQRSIASLLMDQTVLAGIGNVYRAEVLFRHRVDPYRRGNALTRKQWLAIWDDLVVLMHDGVAKNRIDTVREEHTPEAMGRDPRVDDHGGEVYVYRRTGQPCHVCGATVRTAELEGRNLFWCPRCQRASRSRATS
ncbi:DNA-formamidopyrimidine glycosylase family protein [Nocardioides sp. CER19]|uniref:Fpg/Nei family DNA glycosylase n=1 Tax=Nocardioides sp. CER19 TaxID=3038538 RepID=UPI00244904F4|nr:DNA-formamidopyrimidine glycosylase family protein [Nocardioides sp. CER19]MDH2414021.1 zinc finger domain-containing protein [Nocardioides sp. CER19]